MTEEEKKAIERLEEQLNFWKKQNIKNSDCEIILNLITKLQKENEEKDKQIDLMALTLSNVCTGIPSIIEQFEKEYCEFINSNEDCCWKTDKNCQDCIKQYFEKQAKEKGD